MTNTFTYLHTLWRYSLTTVLIHRQLCPTQPGLEAGLLKTVQHHTTPAHVFCCLPTSSPGASNLSTFISIVIDRWLVFLQDELFLSSLPAGTEDKARPVITEQVRFDDAPRQRLQKVRSREDRQAARCCRENRWLLKSDPAYLSL